MTEEKAKAEAKENAFKNYYRDAINRVSTIIFKCIQEKSSYALTSHSLTPITLSQQIVFLNCASTILSPSAQ
jgi:hypothetical protein